MASPQDFKSLQDKVQAALVATVKSVNRVSAEDLPFQRAVNPSVGDDLDSKTTRILELSTTLLKSAAEVCGLSAPDLEDADDVDMRWRSIVDVVDSILEKADTSIDEYTGALKRKDAPAADAVSALRNRHRISCILTLRRPPKRRSPRRLEASSAVPTSPSPNSTSTSRSTITLNGNPSLPKSPMLRFL